MARINVGLPAIAIAAAVLVGACSALIDSATPPPTPAAPLASGSNGPALASQSAGPTALTCGDLFTPPPYDMFIPVEGVTVRAIDKRNVEITNATSRNYYFGVSVWTTEDNLICGRGVIAHSAPGGRLRPETTVLVVAGSTRGTPVTVAIWADACGEGCNRVPLGEYVVPVSSVEPPEPGGT